MRKRWRDILMGVIAIVSIIALLLGLGVIGKEADQTFTQLQAEFEQAQEEDVRLWEENARFWQESARLWEEANRIPELTVERKVRFRSGDWTDRLEVKTGRQVEFLITINSTAIAHNVWLQVELPSLIYNKGNLKVDGVPYFGDVIKGVNIGTVTPCGERTITFEGQIATASLFPVGTTTLIVPVEVWADCVPADVGEITITVERSAPASGGGRTPRPPDDCPPGGPADPPLPGDGRD